MNYGHTSGLVRFWRVNRIREPHLKAPPHGKRGGALNFIQTSPVSSMNVMFVLIPSGHSTCNFSLFNCSRKTTSTKSALNIMNAKTDLLRKSFKSRAIRLYNLWFFIHSVNCFVVVPFVRGRPERQHVDLSLSGTKNNVGKRQNRLVNAMEAGPNCPGAGRWLELRSSALGVPSKSYLLRRLIVGNIRFDTEGPFNVQIVLVQLQQEHD